MDRLPVEVLTRILAPVYLRDKFVMMRVSRRFEAACRFLVAEQRVLVILRTCYTRQPPNMAHTLMMDRVGLPSLQQMRLSLAQMKCLTSVTVSWQVAGTKDVAEESGRVFAANAAHLQTLRFVDDDMELKPRFASCKWLLEIPFPELRVMSGCRVQDLAFLVEHSPLLREIATRLDKYSLSLANPLSRLANLEVVEFKVNGYDSPSHLVMLLLRGSSRYKLQRITVATDDFCGWTSAVVQEVQRINEETGRQLQLLDKKAANDDSSSDSDDDDSDYDASYPLWMP